MLKKITINILFLILFFLWGDACADVQQPVKITLDDAILLALRENPSVQTIRLTYLQNKLNLKVEEWKFKPHFSFTTNYTYLRNSSGDRFVYTRGLDIQPGVSLLTDIGTKLSLTGHTTEIGNLNPGASLNITQPLLKGFGKPIVEQALNNARDSLYTSGLNVENTLRATVTSVISSYLDEINAERTVAIDQQALKRAQSSVIQTKKFIKAGSKAGNELITVEANVATAQSNLANDQNNMIQAKYALLTAIGLDPNSNVIFSSFDLDTLINKYNLPTLEDTKNLVLENDIQYRIDQITFEGSTQRALLAAEDNTRWDLGLTANIASGGFTNNKKDSSVIITNNPDDPNSPITPANATNITQSESVNLTLTIPIDDLSLRQQVQNQKIAIREAEIGLKKEKWDKETSAINSWNYLMSAKRSLQFAISAEKLQEQTYSISYQKYLHGLIDSLQLQSAQLSLIQSQQSLLSSRISYIKALVNMDQLIGRTLQTWNIPVRLP